MFKVSAEIAKYCSYNRCAMPAFPSTSTVMVPSTIVPFLSHTQSFTTLNIYYQNIRGVRTKVNELRLYLSESHYNIIILAESWFHENLTILGPGVADGWVDSFCFYCAQKEQIKGKYVHFIDKGGANLRKQNKQLCKRCCTERQSSQPVWW